MKTFFIAAALFAVAGAQAATDAGISCSDPNLRDAGYQVVFAHVGHSTRMTAKLYSMNFAGSKMVASLPMCKRIPSNEHARDAAQPILRCTGRSPYAVLLTDGDFMGRQHAIVERDNHRFGTQSLARLICSRPE